LRAGRLDLTDLGEEVGNWEASHLATLWEQLLQKEGEHPSQSLLKLIPNLADRGIVEPLMRGSTHRSVDVRHSCITALASTDHSDVTPILISALGDTDARVRLAALRGLAARGDAALLENRAAQLIGDADPEFRAEAALQAGREGLNTLEQMIASPVAAQSVAALAVTPVSLFAAAERRLYDPEPSVRAAALECVARIATEPPISLDEAKESLLDDDPRVRRAAVLLLANLEGRGAIEAVASAISDSSNEVQFAAESVLISLAEEGAAAVESALGSDSERTASAALRVTARCDHEHSAATLRRELRSRVRELWLWLTASRSLTFEAGPAAQFLRAAYSDGVARNQRLAFQILELLEGPRIVRNVEKALRFGSQRSRGDALEVLSHLGDREAAQLLVTRYEASPLEDQIEIVRKLISLPEEPQELIAAARASRARWIQLGAHALASQADTEIPEEEVMERLLALKEISLFQNLSLDQLEAVQQISTEVEYLPGEVLMREGERGNRLYLLLSGRVRVFKDYGSPDETQLNEQSAVSYFGEMGILDGGTRSASVVAMEPSHVLSLNGNSLRELLLEMPEISFELFRVLVGRLRAAEQQISAG